MMFLLALLPLATAASISSHVRRRGADCPSMTRSQIPIYNGKDDSGKMVYWNAQSSSPSTQNIKLKLIETGDYCIYNIKGDPNAFATRPRAEEVPTIQSPDEWFTSFGLQRQIGLVLLETTYKGVPWTIFYTPDARSAMDTKKWDELFGNYNRDTAGDADRRQCVANLNDLYSRVVQRNAQHAEMNGVYYNPDVLDFARIAFSDDWSAIDFVAWDPSTSTQSIKGRKVDDGTLSQWKKAISQKQISMYDRTYKGRKVPGICGSAPSAPARQPSGKQGTIGHSGTAANAQQGSDSVAASGSQQISNSNRYPMPDFTKLRGGLKKVTSSSSIA